MNIAVLPSCHRPPVSRPSPSDRDIAKTSLKFPRPPRAQIYRTAAGLPPQCHPPTSSATARWFGDVFAMPHLHIRHRRCQKKFKGVVKTCDAFLRCPNFPVPPQCHRSAAGVPPGDVCKCMQMRSPTHREGHRKKCDHGITRESFFSLKVGTYLDTACSYYLLGKHDLLRKKGLS